MFLRDLTSPELRRVAPFHRRAPIAEAMGHKAFIILAF